MATSGAASRWCMATHMTAVICTENNSTGQRRTMLDVFDFRLSASIPSLVGSRASVSFHSMLPHVASLALYCSAHRVQPAFVADRIELELKRWVGHTASMSAGNTSIRKLACQKRGHGHGWRRCVACADVICLGFGRGEFKHASNST